MLALRAFMHGSRRGTSRYLRGATATASMRLVGSLPAFSVDSDSVDVLSTPSEFYDRLMKGVTEAKSRVVLCSLYLGTGEKERKLADALFDNHKANDQLETRILLDALRGSRTSKDAKTGRDSSSLRMLHRVALRNNAKVHIFHTPHLHGVAKKIVPQRADEVFGVQHMKYYIFDDTVICSGANLSSDYFTNRQDRYIVVRNAPRLAAYCTAIVETMSSLSYQYFPQKLGSRKVLPLGCPPPEAEPEAFRRHARKTMELFLEKETCGRAEELSVTTQRLIDVTEGRAEMEDETIIVPTVEMASFGIHQDRQHLLNLIQGIKSGSWFLASAYFNIYRPFLSAIRSSRLPWTFLTASPKANGFYGAKGLAGYIPDMYRVYEAGFLEAAGEETRMMEYEREGWTYHGKGLWWCPAPGSPPTMTIFGSANFGERSYTRDVESQLTLVTRNKKLQGKLDEECKRLLEPCREVTADSLRKEAPGILPRLLARAARTFL